MNRADIEFFTNEICNRKDAIINTINSASNTIDSLNNEVKTDSGDYVSAQVSGILNAKIIQQYNDELSDIEKSLAKITNGEYGICEMCGEEIAKDRLIAKLHAKFCISCREIYEKEKKIGRIKR